jgi:hypothetical protein
MSTAHAIRPLQFTALVSLTLLLAALACVRVHQTSNQDWALWAALFTLSSGCLCAGYLIGAATPAHAKAKVAH